MVDGKLYAFYVAESKVDEQVLESFVRQHLPFYSVPERWTYVPEIPLTPNGKVDKKALVEFVLSAARPSKAAPITLIAAPGPAISSPVQKSMLRVDSEKVERYGSAVVTSSLSVIKEATVSISDSLESEIDRLPEKKGFHGQRWLRHRAFILYRRFFSVVLLANVAAACLIL
jgi:hypothetical protein